MVVDFEGKHALAMPFAALDGVQRGCRAVVSTDAGMIRPSERWLGRAVGVRAIALSNPQFAAGACSPPSGGPLDRGVRVLNTFDFITCCRGQSMGIFSGSGVSKSVLPSMLACDVAADVSVIGLVG